MNIKTLVIGVIVLLIIGVGAYALMSRSSAVPAQPAAAAAAAGQPQPQSPGQPQVQAQDKTVGIGVQATPGTIVSVLYEGRFKDGTVFDSSAMHKNEPLKFQLGNQNLIAGFQIGVNGMKEGGERLIIVPAALGYGTQDVKDPTGKVIIPANSELYFDIKLVKVEPAPAATPPATPTKK